MTAPDISRSAHCALPATRADHFRGDPGQPHDRIQSGAPLFEGIVGYDDTVLPGVQRALLAGHSMNLLGLRGQAKTRIARGLTDLLDEWVPVLPGSPLPEDPMALITQQGRALLEEGGEDTPSRGCTAASAMWRSSPRRM